MTTFALPDLGEGLQEAEIVTWHVSVGDHVTADQPLVSVETDKAVVEIPAPFAGTVSGVHGDAGDIVAIGAPLAEIDPKGSTDKGAIVGEIEPQTPPPAMKTGPSARPASPRRQLGKATPAVRRLALEKGVDLSSIVGTGPGGAITSADVEASPHDHYIPGEALRGVRRAMSRTMTRAGAEIVPATLTDHADLHHWDADQNPTIRLIQAMVAACTVEPNLNVWFDGRHQTRTLHAAVNLGLATDTAEGLFVPVLSGVEKMSAKQIKKQIAEIKAAVQARTIAPEDLHGATISLSNFGMMAGEHAALVIAPPQVAILGAGRMSDNVVAVEGAPAVHRRMPLSLTFDHRAVSGGEAARFMAAVIADLEQATHQNNGKT